MKPPVFSRIGFDLSSSNIGAVCISRNRESLVIPNLPFHNYVEGWKPFEHEKTIERVSYLADRRNKAVAELLDQYPETKHVLMIDSYYLQQGEEVRKLIEEYSNMSLAKNGDEGILGASSWVYDKTRVRPRFRFYDGWTTPEGMSLELRKVQRDGRMIRVRAVGGCYLYPRWVWEKIGYGVPADLHGCEHNWLCENSGLPVFLSLNVRLWREPIIYSRLKRLRMTLHLRRLFD
jgi:hypothetical protein